MSKNSNLENKITPKLMNQALKIINEAWVSMTGDDFARFCLDSDPNGPSKNWINENFRRFQNDLGGQINKTSGDYMQKLAAGLVKFYDEQNAARTYYILAVNYGSGYGVEFGAYTISDVLEEKYFILNSFDGREAYPLTKIIKTNENQLAIDAAINQLNREQ